MYRHYLFVSLCLVPFTASAEESSPVIVKRGTIPLVTDLEQRLARADANMRSSFQRPAELTDGQLTFVLSKNFANYLQPAFPECLPGVELLLKHSDLRIRHVGLKLLANWVDSQRRERTELDPETSSRLRGHCLSSLKDTAEGKPSPALCQLTIDFYLKLSNKQPTPEEQQSFKQLLTSNEMLVRKAALDVLLVTESTGPDETLCQHIENLLQSDSEADQQWMAQHLRQCPVVSPPLRETLCRILRKDPHNQGASRIAVLLAKSTPVPKEAIPGLIEVISQSVPRASRGGMCCLPQSDNHRQMLIEDQSLANQALREFRHITVVPLLMPLLDHPEIDVRRRGVHLLGSYGSLALGAIPKLVTMDKHDHLAASGWQLGSDFGIESEVYSVIHWIAFESLVQLCINNKHTLLLNTAYVGMKFMNQTTDTAQVHR